METEEDSNTAKTSKDALLDEDTKLEEGGNEDNSKTTSHKPLRPGYLDALSATARSHPSLLLFFASISYAAGWLGQSYWLSSLGVGVISPSRERAIAFGIILILVMWPFFDSNQILRRRNRTKKEINIEQLWRFFMRFVYYELIFYSIIARPTYQVSLLTLFLCAMAFLAVDARVDSKKVFEIKSALILFFLVPTITGILAINVRPELGGSPFAQVQITLANTEKPLSATLLAEDDECIVYSTNAEERPKFAFIAEDYKVGSPIRIPKSEVKQIERQTRDMKTSSE